MESFKGLDMRGMRFGKLVVVEFAGRSGVHALWECRCDCGAVITVYGTNLRGGKSSQCSSCGHAVAGEKLRQLVGEMPVSLWTRIVRNAKNRGIDVLITPEYAADLFVAQGRKCAMSSEQLSFGERNNWQLVNITASLDRIDTTRGYEEGNVQWVHKDVNLMKGDMSLSEFIHWCRLVANHPHSKSGPT